MDKLGGEARQQHMEGQMDGEVTTEGAMTLAERLAELRTEAMAARDWTQVTLVDMALASSPEMVAGVVETADEKALAMLQSWALAACKKAMREDKHGR